MGSKVSANKKTFLFSENHVNKKLVKIIVDDDVVSIGKTNLIEF